MSRARCLMLGVLAVAACARPDAERRGDEAYADGRFAEAFTAYASAGKREGRVAAKVAAAAFRAGLLDSAAAAYEALGRSDRTRAAEAADGLEEVAERAGQEGAITALRRAVLAIRELAPERPIGRHAYVLLQRATLDDTEAAVLLPAALAVAPRASVFDSLLLRYGTALSLSGDCGGAAAAFRGVLARSADSARRSMAGRGLAECALRLGTAALDAGRPLEADRWFTAAAAHDTGSAAGRRALVGLGDARLAEGDTIAAAIVWTRARSAGAAADSIDLMAARRLRAVGATDNAGDSTRTRE